MTDSPVKTYAGHTAGDWTVFVLIHVILFGAIAGAAFFIYGKILAPWVAGSALIAGLSASYLYAKRVKGATAMKILVYLFSAANAAYMVHNGARMIGVEAFNRLQVEKFTQGMAQTAQASSRKVAHEMGLSAESAGKIEKIFDDDVSLFASLGAFGEIFMALIVLAIASRHKPQDEPEAAAAYRTQAAPDLARPWDAEPQERAPQSAAPLSGAFNGGGRLPQKK